MRVNNMNYWKSLFLGFVLIVFSGQVLASGADDFATYVWTTAKPIVCGIYFTFMLIAGSLASVMIVYGGIKWITSGDDPGARKTAKETIIHGVIGLIIVVAAAGLVDLVISGEKCW